MKQFKGKFQFQYGAIKSPCKWVNLYPFCDFNSSMVRLRADSGEDVTDDFFQFQFQYGAIKSILQN